MILDPYTWADPSMLIDELGYDPELSKRAVANASWILWALSGRQLHGQGNRVDLYRPPCQGRRDWALSMRPVRDVTSVEVIRGWSDEVTTLDEGTGNHWTHYQNIVVLRGMGFGQHDRLRIKYTVKSNLPPGTYEVVLKLAEEYLKAAAGTKCNLPQRVTNVTRQGVTWTILDPADFLEKGKTGIINIDQWLAAVNPRQNAQRAQVFNPQVPRLLSSKWQSIPFDSATVNSVITWYGHGALEDLDPEWLEADVPEWNAGEKYVDVSSGETYEFT